jgi:WD domain, G-beta repeat
VTASADKTARIWDAASGRELMTLSGHAEALTSAAFGADGKHVVTASQDKTVRIWDVSAIPQGNILTIACALLPDKRLDGLVGNFPLTIDKPICGADLPPPHPFAVGAAK